MNDETKKQGPVGATGPSGPKGDTGDQGPKGDTGDRGPSGEGFFDWFSSVIGDFDGNGTINSEDIKAWLKGDIGPKGDTGAKGATGATGANGSDGATGATGAQGDAGATGATGSQGPAGADGANGQGFFDWFSSTIGDFDSSGSIDQNDVRAWLKGDKGDTGATGATGPQGPAGAGGSGMPGMVQSGVTYTAIGNIFNLGLFIWNGGSTATLWTNKGEILFSGVEKEADGRLTATGGRGRIVCWHGDLVDTTGDGKVLAIGTQNADGSFDLLAELKAGMTLTANLF